MREFFGFDDDWVRPLPPAWWRADGLVALGVFVFSLLGIEVMRALGDGDGLWARWALYAAVALGSLPLVWRRRFPVIVMLVMSTHLFVFGITQYVVMANITMQAAYFFAIFSALAWGRDRRVTALATGGVLLFMFGWVAVQLSVASLRDEFMRGYGSDGSSPEGALFGLATASVLYSIMINVLFFTTAVTTGANSWRGARARARAEEQAHTIEEQAAQLTERAVVDERLRIARELHDVVAHHVAAIGIQAAASRKLLTKDPALAAESLANVETSSRDAVTQMRSLLGTLRTRGEDALPVGEAAAETAVASRAPEPTVADLPSLVEQVSGPGFDVRYTNLAEGLELPAPVSHSLYRTVQEALANVRRHSTATAASVTLRGGDDYIEVEVLDDGRPRQGTSGSGLGLLGMRERVTAHRGTAEIGPRLTGGYRVRVRFPLETTKER